MVMAMVTIKVVGEKDREILNILGPRMVMDINIRQRQGMADLAGLLLLLWVDKLTLSMVVALQLEAQEDTHHPRVHLQVVHLRSLVLHLDSRENIITVAITRLTQVHRHPSRVPLLASLDQKDLVGLMPHMVVPPDQAVLGCLMLHLVSPERIPIIRVLVFLTLLLASHQVMEGIVLRTNCSVVVNEWIVQRT
jgi:hypothetical protein